MNQAQFETNAASWIQRMTLHEEELRPLPEDSSVAMLVTRVVGRLAEAAHKCPAPTETQDPHALTQVAAHLIGAAAFAVTGITRVNRVTYQPTIEHKNWIVDRLDQDIAGTMESEADFFEAASAMELVQLSLALLDDACEGVAELEGEGSTATELRPEEVLDQIEQRAAQEEDETSALGSPREQIADSLWHVAINAGAAAESLISRTAAGRPSSLSTSA